MRNMLVLWMLLTAGSAAAVENPMSPGKWVISIEFDAGEIGKLPPMSGILCFTKEELAKLDFPVDFINQLQGCDLLSHRFEGGRNFFSFECPGQGKMDVEIQYASESFVLAMNATAGGLFSLKAKGGGQRAGACATVDDTEALIVAARAYAAAENGIAIVFVRGKTFSSEMLNLLASGGVKLNEGVAILNLVSSFDAQRIRSKPFFARLDVGNSAMYYVFKSETLGPWSFDQFACAMPVVLKRELAKSAAEKALMSRLLALLQKTSLVDKSLLSVYEEQTQKKVDRADTRAMGQAVGIANYMLAVSELTKTAGFTLRAPDPAKCTKACKQDKPCSDKHCTAKPVFRDEVIEKALRDYEKRSGRDVNRHEPVDVAEALLAILGLE